MSSPEPNLADNWEFTELWVDRTASPPYLKSKDLFILINIIKNIFDVPCPVNHAQNSTPESMRR